MTKIGRKSIDRQICQHQYHMKETKKENTNTNFVIWFQHSNNSFKTIVQQELLLTDGSNCTIITETISLAEFSHRKLMTQPNIIQCTPCISSTKDELIFSCCFSDTFFSFAQTWQAVLIIAITGPLWNLLLYQVDCLLINPVIPPSIFGTNISYDMSLVL